MLLLLGFSFLAGVFTALSPCILPILPAVLAAGVAGGRLRPLGTILGLICSFSFFTLSLTWIVHATGFSPHILRDAAAVLIFLFGLILLFPRLSLWFAGRATPLAQLGQKIQGAKKREGFWGGVLFGSALGLLWTPCAGPILATITVLVATSSVTLFAVLMTFSYSMGAGLPLLLLAYGSAKLVGASRFLSRYSERIRQFFGILMMLFALLLLFNAEMLLNKWFTRFLPTSSLEKAFPVKQQLQSLSGEEHLTDRGPAPEITGISAWINSSPLTLAELRGKVVLIDFWTYSCINCIRTLPYLKNWYRDYKDKGFVLIGVHTPEFEFEKAYGNVKNAAAEFGINYPIALDNNYATWRAYHNAYWPAHYLIDQEGNIRLVHYGEGAYVEMENAIRDLLGISSLKAEEIAKPSRPISPEIYLGSSRGNSYKMSLREGVTQEYAYTSPLEEDQVGLRGLWRVEREFIEAMEDASYLDLNFLATRVYLVMTGSSDTPLETTLDGKPYGLFYVDGNKEYTIVKTSYQRHQLSLKIPKGIRAYTFTFGDE